MDYRELHKANERYKLTVMWVLIAAFFVALILMFFHPSAAIAVFWFGLLVVVIATIIEKRIQKAERNAAQVAIQHQKCPSCGAAIHREPGAEGPWRCDACEAEFLDSGAEQSPSMVEP
jgi:hypothetical protein